MSEIYIDDEDSVSILSIDPGTTNLGYAIIKINITTTEIIEAFAWTVDATRLVFYREDIIPTHSEKFARIISHKQNLKNVLDFYKPLIVVSETPFFNMKRASAAGPLYELLTTVEQTIYEWDKYKPLYKIDPKTVKKTVGASHNAKKPEMRECVSKVKELSCACLDLLDEHSIDALAVGYAYVIKQIRNRGKQNV